MTSLSHRLSLRLSWYLGTEFPPRVVPLSFQSIMTYLQLCLSAVPTETPGIHSGPSWMLFFLSYYCLEPIEDIQQGIKSLC